MTSEVDVRIAEAAQTAAILFRKRGWTWGYPEPRPVTEADLALAIKRFSRTAHQMRTGRLCFLPVFDEVDGEPIQTGVQVLVEVDIIPMNVTDEEA